MHTKYPIILVHGIAIRDSKILRAFGKIEKRLSDAGFSVWDVETEYQIDPETFLSMGRATPFAGDTVYGKCLMTIYGGKMVWQSK